MDSQRSLAAIAGSPWITRLVGLIGILLIIQIIAMRFNPTVSFIVAATAFARHGLPVVTASVDLSWYPPSSTVINNLTNVLTATGVYGFIYNNSYPTDVRYGTYNWCNMPHVRKEEYVKPSSDYKLKYVEIVSAKHLV
jgi:acid phosphatase